MDQDQKYILRAIEVAKKGIQNGNGGPFGAVIIRGDEVISESSNMIYKHYDPTAHAEIMAIRLAGKKLGHHKLFDCTLYASCEPCPMCFSAVKYAGIKRVVFAAWHKDAEEISGFGIEEIQMELQKNPLHRDIPHRQVERAAGLEPFQLWEKIKGK